MYKNVAGQFVFLFARDVVADIPMVGDAGNITAYITKDNGSVNAAGNGVSELDATNAKGLYKLALASAAESNGDIIAFTGVSTTAGIEIIPLIIQTQTVMRGTDGVSLVVPDVAGIAASLHSVTDGKIDTVAADTGTTLPANQTTINNNVLANLTAIGNLNNTSAAGFVTALMAHTGITAGGVYTFEKIMKVIVSILAGNIRDKSGSSGTHEILDPDDKTTVIGELVPSTSTPYRNLTIL